MATTEQLKVKITADASQAKAEIGKFKDSLKDTASATENATAAVGKLKGAMVALVAVKAAKAIKDMALDVASMGDQIKDNAQKVFMGTTAYQEWGYVLKQNGVEMTALKTAMRQFAPQVAAGSDTLRKYGITATDVDAAFEQAIMTIQNMETETERLAAAQELFGTRALELMPVLNLTNGETQNLMATYRALGATMSNELIAASDVCADSITAMKAAWGGLRNVLAAYVIPIITKVVQWITIAIAYVRILLSAILGIKSTFGGGSKKTSLPATTGSVATNTGNTAKNLGKAAKHAKELKRTLMGIDELSRLVEQATAAAASPSGGGSGGGVGDVGGGADVGDFGDIISDETLEKIESFRKKVEAIKDILNGCYLILKGLVEIALGNPIKGVKDLLEGLDKIWQGLKENFPWLQKVEDAWKKLGEKWTAFKEAVGKKAVEFKAELQDKVKEKWEKLKTWWAGRKVAAKEFLAELKDKVKDKWTKLKEWWGNRTIKAKEFIAELKEKVKAKWAKLKEWWKNRTVSTKTFTAEFLDKVKAKWNAFKRWWNGLKDGVKNFTVNFSFVDRLRAGWNELAKKINDARAKSTVVAELIPYIPALLAKGGVLTSPTNAILGEYAGARSNPEIATPQSLMYETIQKANGDMVSAFATMTRQIIAVIEDKDLVVNIGDEQVARSAQRGNSAYKNRTGKALLTI